MYYMLLKNYDQKCLNNLTILNIEPDLTKIVNYDIIIDKFVNQFDSCKKGKYLINGVYFSMVFYVFINK